MAGINSDTKLMLHCNGSDESTTFTDDSPSEHTVSAIATAQLDTSVKKFGTASGMFDGDSDYLTIPDSSDFDVVANDSDNWTLDCWLYYTGGTLIYICGQTQNSATEYWKFAGTAYDGRITFGIFDSGWIFNARTPTNTVLVNTWYHIATCKVADEYGVYVGGVQKVYASNDNTLNFSAPLKIGGDNEQGNWTQGWIDELRIQKSNYFNASPNVGLTDTITVPTEEYSETVEGILYRNQSIIIS